MINISSNSNPALITTRSASQDAPQAKEADSVASSQVTKLATVSKQARELESLQQELRSLPEVDLERVNQVRAELQQGQFSVDLDELAAAIFTTHQGE
ncbi:flagellar biosynthesis anti-sigma factor FlgM [Vibrio sp. WXL103]|uniref:flagellar biosynthesis anti-sigma factor FlgM n=1 Tax=unclassified Vibrio TaxID=2614977 RepID=UPI0030DE7F9F